MRVDVVLPTYAVPVWDREVGDCARWIHSRGRWGRDGVVRMTAELDVSRGDCLDAALRALTAVDRLALDVEELPPLYGGSVRFALERGEVLRYAGDVARLGRGDCDDLATWRAAELQRAGHDATAVTVVQPPGSPTPLHVLVQTARGFEDPTQLLGASL